MSGILWIASYPKSGNTWVRVFFENLLSEDGAAVSINQLRRTIAAGSRGMFDEYAGVEASSLTQAEIDRYRPGVYRFVANEVQEPVLIKAHDAYWNARGCEPLFPADASFGAIYVLRNPLDIAVSFAHHYGISTDLAIAKMANDRAELSPSSYRLRTQLRQRILSWRSHVLSWVDQDSIPVHLVRYEDLVRDPVQGFASIAGFACAGSDAARVGRAIERSSFAELQRQEQQHGFTERHSPDQPFFRAGKCGTWREALRAEQVIRVVRKHGDVMRRFGYLSADGNPLA